MASPSPADPPAIDPQADAVFEREFLGVRAKLLEIAASLDRVGRAAGEPSDAGRQQQIRQAIETLLTNTDDRAERIQTLFSLPFDPQWREKFKLD